TTRRPRRGRRAGGGRRGGGAGRDAHTGPVAAAARAWRARELIGAGGRAARGRRPIRCPVVALLACIDDAVAAEQDFPDARVAEIRDEEVARAVERNALRAAELGRGGGPAVAAEALGPGARHGRDRPRGRVHPPDARAVVVVGVPFALLRDEEVARAVERDAYRDGPARDGRDPPRARVHPPHAPPVVVPPPITADAAAPAAAPDAYRV